MRDCAGVPELCKDAAAGSMDGIGDPSPSAHLFLRPQSWRISPAKSLRANRGGLGDDQSSRSTLCVILRLQGRGHMIVGLRTHPSERRHDDAVRKVEVSHSIWCEKWLIRYHVNSCIDRRNMLKKSLQWCRPAWDRTQESLRYRRLPRD